MEAKNPDITEQDMHFMELAAKIAEENIDRGGGPFGAVVVRNGEVVATGANSVTLTNDPTAHAEVNAIREACRKEGSFSLAGCRVYSSCEPCPMCLGAIYWARPARVYYAATKDDAAQAGFDDSFIYRESCVATGGTYHSFPQGKIAVVRRGIPLLDAGRG